MDAFTYEIKVAHPKTGASQDISGIYKTQSIQNKSVKKNILQFEPYSVSYSQ